MGAVFAFVLAFFLLDFPIQAAILRIGRNLETRLRIRFLEKIPRLSDRYFQSRLTSDMTQRMHGLRQIRTLPHLGLDFLRLSFQMLFTAIGIIWLHPLSAPLTILAAVFAVATALLSQPLLIERDLRLRTHLGALSRFYLDTLLGLIPIRTHGAEKAVRREHESLMVEWLRASDEFYRVEVTAGAVDALVGLFFSVLLLSHYIISGGTTSGVLLFFYWALSLPALGRGLVSLAEQYPMQRNQVLRLLEPLNAPEESTLDGDEPEPAPPAPASTPAAGSGAAIWLENVTVRAGGHTILSDLNVQIAPEEHVAIVGPSGAGKSSLVGILLGWHRPAAGRAELDGLRLRGTRLHALRRQTVWVDPAVQLWNRSLLDNLRYGNTEGQEPPGSLPIEQADLLHLLKKLPDGLQTPLGEGGGLVSGGEGQRVRLGRAMLREGARLVILDEPFRGLDRAQRRELLARARHYWRAATLLFISHDIDESLAFERVLVIEDGQIIEDGAPATLAAQPDTRYSALLRADEAVRREMWADEVWRRLWMENGQFGPPPAGEPEQP
jgi:ATP-binding cassette subfamily B protein